MRCALLWVTHYTTSQRARARGAMESHTCAKRGRSVAQRADTRPPSDCCARRKLCSLLWLVQLYSRGVCGARGFAGMIRGA
eukprot:4736910-Prymnesium_polylepis.2